MNSNDRVYDLAELYDIAFSYRNIATETDCLIRWSSRFGREVKSVLELACGPGAHSREFASRSIRVAALDNNLAMLKYLSEQAEETTISTVHADMVDFQLSEKFDLAFIGIDSIAHVLTNANLVSHLRSVANVLRPDGLYILEMAHPAQVFKVAGKTSQNWTETRDEWSVTVDWGGTDSSFDPITQVDTVQVRISAKNKATETTQSYQEAMQLRRWTRNELEACVELSGCFELVRYFGAWDPTVELDNSRQSWRMITLLKVIDS